MSKSHKLDQNQLSFDFSAQTAAASDKNSVQSLSPLEMRRAALGWVAAQKPSGIAAGVPTRIQRYKADVAAFWSLPHKNLLRPDKTLIVEIRPSREHCWPDCSRKEELLPQLRSQKDLKAQLQAEIRKTEPELKDTDCLFDEYESWSYQLSRNKTYHKCCRKIENLEHALYQGSRFEQIRRAHVADYLYLAVPSGAVHPHELADGWGLLYIMPDRTVKEIKKADTWDCPFDNKLHLVQNLAASAQENVLFSYGLRINAKGEPRFTPIPRHLSKASHRVSARELLAAAGTVLSNGSNSGCCALSGARWKASIRC